MYKAIAYFTDLHDNDHAYDVGDIFPRPGITVTEERIKALASSNNKRGEPVIRFVEPLVKGIDEVEVAKPAKRRAKKATAKAE